MSALKNLIKKTKEKQSIKKEQLKPVEQKKKKQVEQEQDQNQNAALVQIENPTQTQKPKGVVVQVKQISQTEIRADIPVEKAPQPVRKSWVPTLNTVVATFDLQKQKEHFVAIGQEYTPPPEMKKGINNFATLNMSEQDKKQNQLLGATLPQTGGIRKFVNSSLNQPDKKPVELNAQQKKQAELQAKLSGLKSQPISKEQRQAKQAQRKRKQEQSKTTGNEPKKIIQFVKSGNSQNIVRQKTAQQLKQQQMQANLVGLKSTALTKQQKQAREAERKRKQQQIQKIQSTSISQEKKVFAFKNSAMTGQTNKTKEKTIQQLKEEQMEAKLGGLKSTALTKEQNEMRKQKLLEKQEQRKKAELLLAQSAISQQTGNKPKFTNSKKTGDLPVFTELQKQKI